jgi:outer membrane lipoprotein-sorting protein
MPCGGQRSARPAFPGRPRTDALQNWRATFCAIACVLALPTLRAADTNAVLDSWFAAQSQVRAMSADFVQTRTLKTLVQPLTATGHLWFSPPNQFRWELGRPAQTIALRHADDMFVIYPRLKRAEHYPLGASAPREWRDAMSLLDAGFPKTRREFESQFQILSLAETNGTWLLALQPRSAAARQVMPELRLSLATNDFSLTGTELVFVDGSRMRNVFTNVVLNAPLDETIFQWQPPADYKVTDPFAK